MKPAYDISADPSAAPQPDQHVQLFRRQRQPPPTLPPIPPSKAGRDPISSLEYLWVDKNKSYKTAKLLYASLIRSLKQVCPEVDWCKLEQWQAHYRPRRPNRDHLSYLRKDDVETFIDFMFRYYPVDKLGDRAIVVDKVELEQKLIDYFSKWDIILAKQPVKRGAATSTAKTIPSSSSSVISPEPAETVNSARKGSSSSTEQVGQGSSPATSTGVAKAVRPIIPEKRRQLIGMFLKGGIERVTRAMIAISNNENPPNHSPSQANGNGGFIDGNGGFPNITSPEKSNGFFRFETHGATEGTLVSLGKITELPASNASLAAGPLHQTPPQSSATSSDHLNGTSTRPGSVSSYREKMMAWLDDNFEGIAATKVKNQTDLFQVTYTNETLDGAQPTSSEQPPSPTVSLQTSHLVYGLPGPDMPTPPMELNLPNGASSHPVQHNHIDFSSLLAQVPHQAASIVQQTPVSSSPEAQFCHPKGYQIHDVHDTITMPETAHSQQFSLQSSDHQHGSLLVPYPQHPYYQRLSHSAPDSTAFQSFSAEPFLHQFLPQPVQSQEQAAQGSAASFLDYLMKNATPIGPDTTPHLAMFAAERRRKERMEQEGLDNQGTEDV
ncbi:hypothetical protein Dda_0727 [Drechslerella dactyloides]|uniref:Uncharacterized protein n=1 Tax=Drechslerella dactyloides TaxID=74499 RepID=A0AAD6NNM8_DREDA|nr:hypothetical protein Dda_0727 [Drechslerella dactyloides]